MHAALKLQCGRVTGNKKFTIGGLTCMYMHSSTSVNDIMARILIKVLCINLKIN